MIALHYFVTNLGVRRYTICILAIDLSYVLSTFNGVKFFGRGNGIALVYGTVMRNLSIALAIAINAFGEAGANAALVIAMAYVIQVQSAAWYGPEENRDVAG